MAFTSGQKTSRVGQDLALSLWLCEHGDDRFLL